MAAFNAAGGGAEGDLEMEFEQLRLTGGGATARKPHKSARRKEHTSNGNQIHPLGGTCEEDKLRKARAAASLGLTHLRCAWGTVQEAATLRALCDIFPEASLREVGLCALGTAALPQEWGFAPGSLPPLGASPDGLIEFHADGGATLEVVEVKNTCPFDSSPGTSRRGANRFLVRDRGPRRQVEPLWVPQLQLHMLCAGAASALLVSRSATHGVRVFRVARDDAYLRLMLCVLSELWTEHVARRRPPPPDALGRLPQHGELLRRTQAIARAAQVVRDVPEEDMPTVPKRDLRFFLD